MNTILAFATAILCITMTTPLTISSLNDPWITAVDSRTGPDWVSASSGRVYTVHKQHAIAIDTRNGHVAWRTPFTVTGPPAAEGNDVAVPVHDGIAMLDRNGRKKAFILTGGDATVAATASNIVALTQTSEPAQLYQQVGTCTLLGYRSGHVLFRLPNVHRCQARMYTFGGDAIGISDGQSIMVYDGRNGKAVAQITGVDQLVGIDGRMLWFSVVGGGVKGLNLDTTRTITMHSGIIKDAVTVEHGVAVAVVDGRLQTVDLLHGFKTQPLKIAGRWVGGPVNNKILVERSDGLYLQPVLSGAEALRVAHYTGEARYITSDRKTAIAAVSNGTIYLIDTGTAQQVAAIPTSCRIFEGFSSSGKTTVAQCDDDRGASRLIGFNRYLRASRVK